MKSGLEIQIIGNDIGVVPITQYMHVHNKKSNTQESSPNVVNMIKGKKLLPEGVNFSFKRSSHFEKGHNCRESLLDTVVSL